MTTLAIVTNHPTASGVSRLQRAAHNAEVDTVVVHLSDSDAAPQINDCNVAVFRISTAGYEMYKKILPWLDSQHQDYLQRCLNAFDKAVSWDILHDALIPVPRTRVIKASDLEQENDYPYVVKVTRGNRGIGVHLVTSQTENDSLSEQYNSDTPLIIQEYLSGSRGTDKRLFVVGETVEASMIRRSVNGDFRANLHGGAKADMYIPTDDEASMAVSAVKTLGLLYGGVDVIDGPDGPLVLEVNPSPGLSIETITDVQLAEMIIKKTIRGYDD